METWSTFWWVVLIATMLAFIPLTLVVLVGGVLDIRYLFRALRKAKSEKSDQ